MPKSSYLAGPIIGSGSGFHADKAGFRLAKCIKHGASAQILAEDDVACLIDAVKLENRFGDISPECGYGHVWTAPSCCLVYDKSSMAHRDAVRWGRPHHQCNATRLHNSRGSRSWAAVNSRLRKGRCEFSARLFLWRPTSWRSMFPISFIAAPYEASLSFTMICGLPYFFIAFFRNFKVAALSCFKTGLR